MNNTKQIIDNHHKRILTASIQTDDTATAAAAAAAAPTKTCNYRRKNTSPLDGNCLQSPVIYQATVTRKDNSIRKKRTSDVYFVNKPLSAAGVSEDKLSDERLSSKFHRRLEASLLGQPFIFRTIFQPWALPSEIPASQKGLLLL